MERIRDRARDVMEYSFHQVGMLLLVSARKAPDGMLGAQYLGSSTRDEALLGIIDELNSTSFL